MKRALVFALLLAGCSQWDTGSVARRSLAEELGCPEGQIEMTQVGAYRYRGEGCHREATVLCSASRLEPQCLRQATAGGQVPDEALAEREAPIEEEEPAEPTEAPAVRETPDAEIEAQIRAGLDARRDDVLACIGRDRVAVRAGYAPDGSVALSLQGDLAGTPEERCVQDVLDGVRVAATGEAGVVIHLLRR